MARAMAWWVGLGLWMALGTPALAQVNCSGLSPNFTAALLAQFQTTAPNGSIGPVAVQNFICSVTKLLSPGSSALVQTPVTSPFQYTAQIAGNLIVSSGAVAISRNNGSTFYPAGLTGGTFALANGDIVQVTWFQAGAANVPIIVYLPNGP